MPVFPAGGRIMMTPICPVMSMLEVSSDRLTVTLKAADAVETRIAPERLIAELRLMNIPVADATAIEKLAGPDGQIQRTHDIVLLRGQPPQLPRPAKIELQVTPPDPESVTSHYERTAYLTTHVGQAIARLAPGSPGEAGIDVFGNSIAVPKATAPPPALGENVELDPDGQTVCATSVGRICRNAFSLWVQTGAEIPGDVDFSCGNIDVAGDVHIRGSVLDRFKVKGLNIHVGGAVEAAEIIAAGDLHVRGGILGKDKGRCTAGGDITCKYATNVALIAGGNISSHSEIAHAQITCGGKLTVERGPLASGRVSANGGVSCKTLGSVTERVLLDVGVDQTIRCMATARLYESLTGRIKTAGASDVHQRAADLLRGAWEASRQRSNAEVLVQNLLLPGVTIRFPHVQASITSAWKGPLCIVPVRHQDQWEIVLVDVRTRNRHPLLSRPWRDASLEAMERSLGLVSGDDAVASAVDLLSK